MSSLIRKFNIFQDIHPNIIQNIKLFNISIHKFCYCVTNNDKVYAIGKYVYKILAYNKPDKNFILVTELCDQNIEEFYDGDFIMFARNDQDQIFCWGSNYKGLLFKGFKSDDYFKPQKVDYFDNKSIVQISCGFSCCLAVSSDGLIYGWGSIGELFTHEPTVLAQLNDINNIKSIVNTWSPSTNRLFFATFDGLVYDFDRKLTSDQAYTNYNLNFKLNVFCDLNNLYQLIVTNENMLGNTISDICYVSDKIMCQTDTRVLGYNRYKDVIDKFEISAHKTFFEYFLVGKQSTFKTYHVKDNQLFVINYERENQKSIHFSKCLKQIFLSDKFEPNQDVITTLKTFRITNDLSQVMESNVKCFYQSGKYNSLMFFAFYILNNNQVYTFGENTEGKLGLGHNQHIHNHTNIPELCDQNIEEFFEGLFFMFARNDKNQIFSWGKNDHGQLARGFKCDGYLKPEKIDFFDDKNIVEINCGYYHCLALSSQGLVYGWGDNSKGQIGCGNTIEFIQTPICLSSKIKFIFCKGNVSIFVQFKGDAYYWGAIRVIKSGCLTGMDLSSSSSAHSNSNLFNSAFSFNTQSVLGYSPTGFMNNLDIMSSHNTESFLEKEVIEYFPRSIPMKTNVFKICFYYTGNFIVILDENGDVFKYDHLSQNIEQINCDAKFNDLYYDYYFCLLQSDYCVYELEETGIIVKTNSINFYDFYSVDSENFKKTILITTDGYLLTKDLIENNENIIISYKNIFFEKFQNNFEEIIQIGSGSFGTVMETKELTSGISYAIKKVEIKDEFNSEEIKIMSKLDTKFVVQYIDAWIEGKVIFNKIKKFLYIQMELCSHNLRDFIESLKEMSGNNFQLFKYFMSFEIFKELTECVNYLHSIPIIHRDLKPENILISHGINGRFLKLCDFGLSKIHEKAIHTQMVGTDCYMAPEIKSGNEYNLKADIYSLAISGVELFQLPVNIREIRPLSDLKECYKHKNTVFETKFNGLLKLLEKCLFTKNIEERPDSKQLLEEINELSVDKNIVKSDENLENFKMFVENTNKKYLHFIFDSKLDSSYLNNLTIEQIVGNNFKELEVSESKESVTNESNYETMFEEICEIGSGSYGSVFAVKNRLTNERFAVKKIQINYELDLREMKIISNLNIEESNEFIVKYINIWIQTNHTFKSMTRILYIQMELCSQNLRDVINSMKKLKDRKFLTFEYFISCELFKELTECVQYLHSIPIIHRDLKPDNILISEGINTRFLKLCDFGLAKVHQMSVHTKGQGTIQYMAPEVKDSNKYNTKSDVYSLALISTEIFQFEDNVKTIRDQTDFNKYLTKYLNTNLENNFRQLLETLSMCLLSKYYDSRPNCKQLLEKIKELSIDKKIVSNDKHLSSFESHIVKEQFLKSFLRKKLDTHL